MSQDTSDVSYSNGLKIPSIVRSFREGRVQVFIGAFWDVFQIMFR